MVPVMAAALLLVSLFGAQAESLTETKDGRGRVTEAVWQDGNGNPAAGPEGYAQVRYTYENTQDGPTTIEMYFNADGTPYRMPGGYYGKSVALGLKNQPTLVEYLDEKGELTMTEMGYARVYHSYRSFGAEYKCVFLGTKRGEVVIVPSLGYAQIETEYTGTIMTGRYFRDTKGKAIDSNAGYSSMIRKLNRSRTQVLQTYYLHANGKPATGPDGWYKCAAETDANGRITAVKYLDENEKLTDAGGFARETYAYDRDGDVTVSRYDAQGNRLSFGGEAVSVLRVMDGELILSETYLNEAGGPVALPEGYAKADYTYSEEGALTMTQYRTATGEKTTCSQGYSAVSQEWDAEGRLTHRMYLDEEGNGVNNRDGVSEERYEYDGEGMLRAVRRYDAGGTQIQ